MNISKKIRTNGRDPLINSKISKSLFFVFFIFITASNLSQGISSASEISAKAAVLMDSDSGKILYAKNPNLRLPPASTAKLVTAMVVLDRLEPDTMVTVSEKAAGTPSVEPKLSAGQKLYVKDLLYLALMRSINGAAVALAETVAGSEKAFVTLMNKKTRELRAKNTKFVNASGLPGRKQYTTARDLAKLLKESLKYPLISEIISTRVKMLDIDGNSLFLKNTNYLLWTDDDQIGGKTGYTRAARHCLVSASRKGDRTFIITLLGERVRDNLWQDAKKLLDKSFEMSNDNDLGNKQSNVSSHQRKVKKIKSPPSNLIKS